MLSFDKLELLAIDKSDKDSIRSEVQDWTEDKRFYVHHLLDNLEGYCRLVMLRDDGQLKAIGSFQPKFPGDDVYVEYLVSRERGYGRELLEEIEKDAHVLGKGVALRSTRRAQGFYNTLNYEAEGSWFTKTFSMYVITQLVGTSSTSWEDAARKAIETAATTIRDLRVGEVESKDVVVENGRIVRFRVRLNVSFRFHPSRKHKAKT